MRLRVLVLGLVMGAVAPEASQERRLIECAVFMMLNSRDVDPLEVPAQEFRPMDACTSFGLQRFSSALIYAAKWRLSLQPYFAEIVLQIDQCSTSSTAVIAKSMV